MANPQIISLVQRHYNFDEKKNQPPARATMCVESVSSPHAHVGFLWAHRFLPTSQSCAH